MAVGGSHTHSSEVVFSVSSRRREGASTGAVVVAQLHAALAVDLDYLVYIRGRCGWSRSLGPDNPDGLTALTSTNPSTPAHTEAPECDSVHNFPRGEQPASFGRSPTRPHRALPPPPCRASFTPAPSLHVPPMWPSPPMRRPPCRPCREFAHKSQMSCFSVTLHSRRHRQQPRQCGRHIASCLVWIGSVSSGSVRCGPALSVARRVIRLHVLRLRASAILH